MINITTWWNTKCVKCEKVEEEMVKIGALVFCKECFFSEFKSTKPIERGESTARSRKYDRWLRKIWGIGNLEVQTKVIDI